MDVVRPHGLEGTHHRVVGPLVEPAHRAKLQHRSHNREAYGSKVGSILTLQVALGLSTNTKGIGPDIAC
jgi:hypothetical protein